jgi:hypothetical protein
MPPNEKPGWDVCCLKSGYWVLASLLWEVFLLIFSSDARSYFMTYRHLSGSCQRQSVCVTKSFVQNFDFLYNVMPACMSVSQEPLNQCTDFNETWHGLHVSGAYSVFIIKTYRTETGCGAAGWTQPARDKVSGWLSDQFFGSLHQARVLISWNIWMHKHAVRGFKLVSCAPVTRSCWQQTQV